MSDEGSAGGRAGAPRRRDKEETQERIIQAAVELFASRGYEGTSVAAIASRAGVSTSAAFWHFNDKEGLFREAFHRILRPFEALLDAELAEGQAVARLHSLVDIYQNTVTDHRETIRTLVGWLVGSETAASLLMAPVFRLHARFEGELERALLEIGHGQGPARQQAQALVAALDGILVLALLQPDASEEKSRLEGLRRLVDRASEADPA
ncbi:MAG: TetR/AcrR family transcriptional regulator [Myxococcota bacterium]|nr:TetR/AcrR family transcriptional regulator [Myxococcota bacterium]